MQPASPLGLCEKYRYKLLIRAYLENSCLWKTNFFNNIQLSFCIQHNTLIPTDTLFLKKKKNKLCLWSTSAPENTTMPHFVALKIYSCGKHCEKRRNCLLEAIFPFLTQCFLPYMALIFHFKCTLKCGLQMLSIWTSLKFCCLVMG